MTQPDPAIVVPVGTRVLHIGPPKTGTSSLQAAFHQNREATLAQGVRYAGSSRHSGSAVLALAGRRSFGRDQGPPPMRRWHNLLADVRGAREARVLISSEFFADVEGPAIRQAIEDLDRDRLHVVVTLRPLDRIIPSQWQQYVQSDLRVAFDAWLEGTLRNPPGPTPTFWRRHRHDRLVERWAAELGPERMTIVVIDESDHDHVLRVFELLLGLRPGTLVADDEIVNRSMTWPEIEAVRAFNIAFKEAGLGNALFHKAMHFGAASYMKTREPGPDEPRIRVPAWAHEPIAEVAREMVASLQGTGIRVVGDLESLVPAAGEAPTREGDDERPEARCITPEVAAAMAVGMAVISGHARGVRPAGGRNRSPATGQGSAEQAELGRYATYQLFGAMLGRARRAVGGLVESLLRRPRSRPEPTSPDGTGSGVPPGSVLEAQLAIDRRFDDEGLTSPAARRLRDRARTLAAAISIAPGTSDDGDGRCVPPIAAAWFALSALEASGAVHAADPARRPGPLRPALWWWLEPPELARIPTARLVLAAPARIARGIRKRAARRGRRQP